VSVQWLCYGQVEYCSQYCGCATGRWNIAVSTVAVLRAGGILQSVQWLCYGQAEYCSQYSGYATGRRNIAVSTVAVLWAGGILQSVQWLGEGKDDPEIGVRDPVGVRISSLLRRI
jgi:hypothetical protein